LNALVCSTTRRPRALTTHFAAALGVAALLGGLAGGCATSGTIDSGNGDTLTQVVVSARHEPPPPRPANADADVAYYRERVQALATGEPTEIARTDFERFRRGRFYMRPTPTSRQVVNWHRDLTLAFTKGDVSAVLDLTGRILDDDQAEIGAHKMREMALLQSGRKAEAKFQRELATSLIQSIVLGGDGAGFHSAWKAFRELEAYDLLVWQGYAIEGRSRMHNRGRAFDILETRSPDDGTRFRAFFDVTEMFDEELRAMSSN